MLKTMFSEQSFRKDIQVLRGVAVISVILFHAFPDLFSNGYLGVDLFFVISGFVMTPKILNLYLQTGESLLIFYKKRFLRLYPAFIFSICISAISIFLFCRVSEHKKFANQAVAGALGLGNIGAIKFSGNYFSPNPNPLLHLWSLAIECQIYFILPIFYLLLKKRVFSKFKMSTNFMQLILILISISFFLYFGILRHTSVLFGWISTQEFEFYSPLTRFWEFGIGGILSYILISSKFLALTKVRTGLFLSLFVLLFLPLNGNHILEQLIIVCISSLIIKAKTSELFAPPPVKTLSRIGDWSYSIYLYHLPFIYIANYSDLIPDSQRHLFKIIAILVSFLVGWTSFRFVELNFNSKILFNKSNLILLTFISLAAISEIIILELGSKSGYHGIADIKEYSPGYIVNENSKCFYNTPTSPPCVFSRGSKNTLLLVGDSHAGHFAQDIYNITNELKWNLVLWTHGGCEVNFYQKRNDSKNDQICYSNNENLKKMILKGHFQGIIESNDLPPQENLLGIEMSTLYISKHVSHLLVVGQTPVFADANFRDATSVLRGKVKWAVSFPKSKMVTWKETSSNAYLKWSKNNNIEIVDSFPIFCSLNECTRVNSTQAWLYADAGHLNEEGSKLFRQKFLSWVSSIN